MSEPGNRQGRASGAANRRWITRVALRAAVHAGGSLCASSRRSVVTPATTPCAGFLIGAASERGDDLAERRGAATGIVSRSADAMSPRFGTGERPRYVSGAGKIRSHRIVVNLYGLLRLASVPSGTLAGSSRATNARHVLGAPHCAILGSRGRRSLVGSATRSANKVSGRGGCSVGRCEALCIRNHPLLSLLLCRPVAGSGEPLRWPALHRAMRCVRALSIKP